MHGLGKYAALYLNVNDVYRRARYTNKPYYMGGKDTQHGQLPVLPFVFCLLYNEDKLRCSLIRVYHLRS